MSNESNEIEGVPNEFSAWRGVLRQPEILPGQGLADKDAAWDRLFERLNERPRRRFYGYRVAAACLLILLIPAARLFHGRSGARDAHPVPAIVRQSAVSPGAAGNTRLTLPASNPGSRRETASTRRVRRDRPQQPTQIATVTPAQPATVTAPQIATVMPPVIAYPPKSAPKKEWKVVDINELDPGHSLPHGMVITRQPVFLRIGPGIGNAGAAETPARDEGSRLKLNLTTQNR